MGLGALTLIAPKAGKAGGSPQLKELCSLSLRNGERVAKAVLRRIVLIHGKQERAPQPMHFSLDPAFLCRLGQLDGFGNPIEPLFWLPCSPECLREHHEVQWNNQLGTGDTIAVQSSKEQ